MRVLGVEMVAMLVLAAGSPLGGAPRQEGGEVAGEARGEAREEARGETPGETVVLIHGLGLIPFFLRAVRRHLEGEGFRVIDWSYPSLREPIDDLAMRLQRDLERWDADTTITRIHIVGHSLGAIVARDALCHAAPRKMGRVVMLAPPNHGSRWARRLAPLLAKWMVPLPELSDEPTSRVNRMGLPPGIPIGILAARRDGKVTVADTHLDGEADHLVVEGRHTFFMNRPSTLRQISTFLREGHFQRKGGEGRQSATNPEEGAAGSSSAERVDPPARPQRDE